MPQHDKSQVKSKFATWLDLVNNKLKCSDPEEVEVLVVTVNDSAYQRPVEMVFRGWAFSRKSHIHLIRYAIGQILQGSCDCPSCKVDRLVASQIAQIISVAEGPSQSQVLN